LLFPALGRVFVVFAAAAFTPTGDSLKQAN